MPYCTTCGSQNVDDSSFCGNCGASLNIKPEEPKQYSPPSQQYQPKEYQQQQYQAPNYGPPQSIGGYQKPMRWTARGYIPARTGWLTLVIIINWIGIIFGALLALFLLFLVPPFGFMILFLLALLIWIVRELDKYNNTARIVSLVLAGLGVLGSISDFDIISLILSIIIIYALAFDKETVALFQSEYRFQQSPY